MNVGDVVRSTYSIGKELDYIGRVVQVRHYKENNFGRLYTVTELAVRYWGCDYHSDSDCHSREIEHFQLVYSSKLAQVLYG